MFIFLCKAVEKNQSEKEKFTTFEFAMYLITQIAIVLWVGNFLLLRYRI